MGKANILIVEDEEKIIEFIESYLLDSGYNVLSATTGSKALEIFDNNDITLILLDLMLPDISGEKICKQIRETSDVPIIMITAKIAEEFIINGLNIGADDYITKPFSPRQLVARVKALLRRTDVDSEDEIFSFNNGKLTIDPSRYEVKKDNEILNLTPTEYKILITLAKRPTKVFTRDELIKVALDGEFLGFDRTIDSHIKNLRHKVETDTKECKYIITVRGIGYKFGG